MAAEATDGTSTPAAKGASRSTGAPVTPAAAVVSAAPAPEPLPEPVMQAIGGGVYVTGTVGLSPGTRYDLRTDGRTFQVIVPSRRKHPEVVFERPLAGVDAAIVEGRLIISASQGRTATVLVFLGKDGGAPENVATEINDAVRASQVIA